ncbi:MAG: hypothetical protein KAH20_06530 [Methylococcales bacterium]|nr:hypothetical protein [Methylococcales bacterium]
MLKIENNTKQTCAIIASVLLLTALTACENAPTRRENLLTQHPEWDSKTISVIRDGKIFKGMTKEQVRASWGRHCRTCQGTVTGTWGDSWEYATQVVFFDTAGKVVRHTPK